MTPDIAKAFPTTRDKIFWSLIAALALGQLVAFWMVCNEQVRRAQAREVMLQVDRVGIADCLRSTPKSTPQKCAARPAAEQNLLLAGDERAQRKEKAPDAHAGVRSTMSGATPAGLMLR
jgi:hypothetical protein